MPIDLPPVIEEYLAWWIAGLIVLFGLLLYGMKDVLRFSLSRAWAISSVNFAESVRRRVLWITPLAIVGVVLVAQFQNPVDEQDAIRQTTKFCLFAAGLVVTLTAIILACTNLPREIESRVIYTVVTKPTTRLEIIVGKVLGFARVSALLLAIMGLFTWGYLHWRSWRLTSSIAERLDAGTVDPVARPSLEYYRQAGLLTARTYERPDDMQIYSRLPEAGDDRRWMPGGGEGSFVVPFTVTPDQAASTQDPKEPGPLGILLSVGFEKKTRGENPDAAAADALAGAGPTSLPYLIQNPDATPEQVRIAGAPTVTPAQPSVTIEILDRNGNTLVDPRLVHDGKPIPLPDAAGQKQVQVLLPPQAVAMLSRVPYFLVQVSAGFGDYDYSAHPVPLLLVNERGEVIPPRPDPLSPRDNLRPIPPSFRTRSGTYGNQLRGGDPSMVPVALYKFRDAPHRPSVGNGIPFEIRVGIERSDADPAEERPTEIEVSFIDRSGAAGESATTPTTRPGSSLIIYPEINRTSYFTVDASAIPSNDFNVVVRCRTKGHYLGVQRTSLAMVTADESFAFNLVKSLLVLWLLSLLVVIVSVFCSTFLSWPIAVVLTILILLGRWGVQQLGDATAPGIGNSVVNDLFRSNNADLVKTVSTTVEALAKMLNWIAAVLPDITRFSAIEDLERGVAVPMLRLQDSLGVIVVFGIPLIVLAYVFLRGKEVAP